MCIGSGHFPKRQGHDALKMKRGNKGLLYRTWRHFSAALGLQRCQVCQNTGPMHPAPSARLEQLTCVPCLQWLRSFHGVRCSHCGLSLGPRPQAFGWTQCRHCRTQVEHPVCQTIVCSDYTPPVDQWITQLKYGKQPHLAEFLGAWLADRLQQSQHPLPHVLIPVPNSAHKMQQRGYNQAQKIAESLGNALGIPVQTGWLEKKRESRTQADLNRQNRLLNLQNAFRATRPMPSDRLIGLVDDVITTGATLNSCIDALRKAGAQHIMVLTVYRTPE
jgi:ComF family protein